MGRVIYLVVCAVFLFTANLAYAQAVSLVTLGDSLTAGDGDDGIGGGYPARLVNQLQTLYPGSVLHQFGISGDTTTDLINKQLTPAVNALNAAPGGNLKIALVWIGSNDFFGFYNYTVTEEWCSTTMGLEACENSEFGQSANNVLTILTTLQTTRAKVYIALLDDQSRRPVITDPVLRAGTFPNITDAYADRMSTRIAAYNNSIQTHAAATGAKTVDFFHTTIFENSATLSSDGNHPNGAGYDAITGIWYNAIVGSSDTTPPVLSNGAPTGILPAGTQQATLSVTSNESATCRFSTVAGISYAAMTNTFATTGGLSHQHPLSNLQNSQSYSYFIRCKDAANNSNTSDYPINFSVAAPAKSVIVAPVNFLLLRP